MVIIDYIFPKLGLQIYENSINYNFDLRDELVKEFIKKSYDELNKIKQANPNFYDFDIKVKFIKHSREYVPKLLIQIKSNYNQECWKLFKLLREVFSIQGNPRLASSKFYIDNDGNCDYFKDDDCLIFELDFIEYKCNEIYKGSVQIFK